MKALMLLSMLALSFTSVAMDDFEQINLDQPINISGQEKQRQLTPAQKLKILRRRREQQNELYAKKKIEQYRLKQEIEMTKRIQKIFDAQMKALESL